MVVIFKIPQEYESMKVFRNIMNVDKDLKKNQDARTDIEFRLTIIK